MKGSLTQAADRMWAAAYDLDELVGDTRVSEWTARKVRDLIRAGRADDVGEIEKLATALERRLERERRGESGSFKREEAAP